jgi:broad specificity phosphatase PhoE
MRLLLIRHGQTSANVRGELDTARPGPGLTALGRAQAAAIPTALAGQPINAIYASTLVRTQQTAAPLARARGLRVTTLDGVHEVEAGDRERASDNDSYRVYLETCMAWGLGERDRMMPGATSGAAFFERFDASIAQVGASGAEVAAVVSHSAAMRVWIAGTARNIEPVFTARQELDNTSMVVLDGSPDGGWNLVSWHGEPLGGQVLVDDAAEDPTGESIDEALA